MIDNFEEKPKLSAEGHVLIKDVDTSEILLDKYNAINFSNLSFAVAMLLAGNKTTDGNYHYIDKMAFGNGGSTINVNGLVEYKKPQVNGTSGDLYVPSPGNDDGRFTKAITSYNVISPDTEPFSDLVMTVQLDYNEPADASDTDTSSDFEEATDYVFDEIGLVTDSGNFLTHLIFHPIQKSKNRKLEIIYTLRIRAGV